MSNGSYPRILILDVTKYDNKSNVLNYFVHDCGSGHAYHVSDNYLTKLNG